ncbi:hypothetical protein [Micromonospora echinaurantiaca]|uniref:hypothetical protein n=1 Tax=Micromonospora echinaurantiaca TaxID=47857 RepID=UPI0018D5836C|nr:hypothetical protein [Micromonospora echinaurantiaca]
MRGFILFLVALIGFFTFYALERATHRANGHEQEPTRLVFACQLGFFALYSGLITYTLATKLDAGLAPAALFAVAMGLHVLATDGVLAEHFPVRRTTRWRLLLVAGAGAGWLTAVVAQPTSVVMNLLTAILGGGILLNVFVDELAPERHSSFAWFTVGLASYSALLAIATSPRSWGPHDGNLTRAAQRTAEGDRGAAVRNGAARRGWGARRAVPAHPHPCRPAGPHAVRPAP